MSVKVLVAYATFYGSTVEVAEAIADTLRKRDFEVDLMCARDVRALQPYGAVVVGAPIAMHRWHKDVRRFLSRNRRTLRELPVAVFALGPVTAPVVEKEWVDARAQLDAELAKFPWLEPVAIEILGGKFDPAILRFPLNKFAGSVAASDVRDWDAIRDWAGTLPETLMAHPNYTGVVEPSG